MSALSPRAVLEVWEASAGRSATAQALAVLAAACPEASPEELAALPLGERDRRLLALRAATLGETLEARSQCPKCGEVLELALGASQLLDGEQPAAHGATDELRLADLVVRCRAPNSADLLAVESCGGPDEARHRLLERCVPEARRAGEPVAVTELEAAEVAELDAALAALDPWAEVQLALECPACRHSWRELFDVASFFTAELASLAGRLLREVHALARGYGWRETDILAMSGRRRQAYLEMLGT